MSEWQPIETAPKDGTPILGFRDGGLDGKMTTVRWSSFSSEWLLCVWGDYAEDAEWPPTHWMPLPPDPDQASQ